MLYTSNEPKKLNVPLGSRSYDIHIGEGALDLLPQIAGDCLPSGEKLVVVSDETVWGLYEKRVRDLFASTGIKAEFLRIPPGEGSKSMEWLSRLYDLFAEAKISRKGAIVAFGGGVTGDLAGFAAATWMRGVSLIQVPTTLLSQVDSSVGGKTGIDIPGGKNLVGAFYQPKAVIIDPGLLRTLNEREFLSGMAEVIKYGAIASPELFYLLRSASGGIGLTEIIEECCRIKGAIVAEDENDRGKRAILNFGHTFGHAIEAKYGYSKYNHGEAVAAGMAIASKIGEMMGVTAPGTTMRIERTLDRFKLDSKVEVDGLLDFIRRDKKADGSGVNLILLRQIGEPVIQEVDFDSLEKMIRSISAYEAREGGPEATPAKTIRKFPSGTIVAPPSKSISHRAIICAALAGGARSVEMLTNLGDSEDIRATLKGVETILSRSGDVIDCGESGSTMRFLIPMAGLLDKEWVFTGSKRLLERPMSLYKNIFENCGGLFHRAEDGIHVRGPIIGGRYEMPGDVSSQFVSGLLMALPYVAEDSEIIITSPLESEDYVFMTCKVMEEFGVKVDMLMRDNGKIARCIIPGGAGYRPIDFNIEGDYTQAANFLASGALGRLVKVDGLTPYSIQGDRRILGILGKMGVRIRPEGKVLRAEPGPSGLVGIDIDASGIPDLVPPLAAIACFARGVTRIYGASRLRIKESDRLHALASALGGLGADIKEKPDGLVINGRPLLEGGQADSWGDHRIAMAIAVAAIGCRYPVSLTGWENVNKSYPGFWGDFEKDSREVL